VAAILLVQKLLRHLRLVSSCFGTQFGDCFVVKGLPKPEVPVAVVVVVVIILPVVIISTIRRYVAMTGPPWASYHGKERPTEHI